LRGSGSDRSLSVCFPMPQEPEDETDDDLDVEGDDTDLRLARLEDLMERRPILVRREGEREEERNEETGLFKIICGLKVNEAVA